MFRELKHKIERHRAVITAVWLSLTFFFVNFLTMPWISSDLPGGETVMEELDPRTNALLSSLTRLAASGTPVTDDSTTSHLVSLESRWTDERVQAGILALAWRCSRAVKDLSERAPEDEIRRAMVEFVASRYDNCAAQFRDIINAYPGDPDARSNYGLALVMLEKMPEAQLHLEALRFGFPEHVPGLLNLALVHLFCDNRSVFDDLMTTFRETSAEKQVAPSDKLCLFHRRWLDSAPGDIVKDAANLREAMKAWSEISTMEPTRKDDILHALYSYYNQYRDTGFKIAEVEPHARLWEQFMKEGRIIRINDDIFIEMEWIPKGSFQMGSYGSELNHDQDEGPVCTVSLNGFWMGKYEVTQEQYEAIMGSNPSYFKGAKNPVDSVSWKQAVKFCLTLTNKTGTAFMLPTEAQWEYACRAGSMTRFNYGDHDGLLGEYAWYVVNSGEKTHPVGGKNPNAWGLHDMHGNVWEWCADSYDSSFYMQNSAGAWNPINSNMGSLRVLRGGSWDNDPGNCRSANRHRSEPYSEWKSFGLRVVAIHPSSVGNPPR